jgi:predicted MFS family arabinose efflux permease
MINDDEVLKARVAGKSVRRIARDHGVSEDAIGAMILALALTMAFWAPEAACQVTRVQPRNCN